MRISHLDHTDRGIKWKECGALFEARGSVLNDPDALLELKEDSAAQHACKGIPVQSNVRLIPTSGESGQVEAIWIGSMSKALPVQWLWNGKLA